ncbi:S-layer homology domain-containing protein [Paenibacillus sp. KN14-4R]|uniref:S-layer homology domain-containing protein n=1 Tax=Paenibacillus sp. KN14-4R TaxID=3445773 RepID=UPI003F9F5985
MIKRKLRNLTTISLIILLFISLSPVSALGKETTFTDVPKEHWAYESIVWAQEQDIVSGYPDGTFKPNQIVGQVAFLSMLIRAYVPKDKLPQTEDDDRLGPYLRYAGIMGWNTIVPPSSKLGELPGAPKGSARFNVTLQRSQAAKIITNANGRNYETDDAIQFLLDSGLVHGKTSPTVEGYEAHDYLTRAEAVTIIKQLKNKQTQLYPSPLYQSQYDPTTLNLSPYENYPLIIQLPQNEPFDKFSKIILTNPTTGYTRTTDSTFTLKGTVSSAVGDHLELQVEYWNGFSFTFLTSMTTIFDKEFFTQKITLPSTGLYRISIKSENIVEGKLNDNTVLVTSFYLDYKN